MFSLFRRTPSAPDIRPQELASQLSGATPPVVIDVRSPAEFNGDGHIAGARLLPLQSLPQRLAEVPRDRPVVLVCRSGARSRSAGEILIAQGYDNLHNLKGGMVAWQLARLPLAR